MFWGVSSTTRMRAGSSGVGERSSAIGSGARGRLGGSQQLFVWRDRRRCYQREREGERTAAPGRAVQPHAAAVQLDKALGEGQAEAGARGRLRRSRPSLVELLEHGLLVLGGDSDAGLAHRD